MERRVQELLSYRIGVEAGYFFSGGIHQSIHRSTSFAKEDVDLAWISFSRATPPILLFQLEIFSDVNKISVFPEQMVFFFDTGLTATGKGRKEELGNITS